jgi:hypothetical protein
MPRAHYLIAKPPRPGFGSHLDTITGDSVQFGFFAGSSLNDPHGLLHGEGKFVRHIKVRKGSDIDERAFEKLLRQAARKERAS